MEYIIPLNPILVLRFNDESDALDKSPVLQVLESYIGIRYDNLIPRLLSIRSGNGFNCGSNLISKLGVYCRHFWWLEICEDGEQIGEILATRNAMTSGFWW